MKKIEKIGIFFGGVSVEHEISVLSARNIFTSLVQAGYSVIGIGIDKSGNWGLIPGEELGDFLKNSREVSFDEPRLVLPVPGGGTRRTLYCVHERRYVEIDCAFPILHGTLGEDGTIQGIFEHVQVPYVGSDVPGSAASMDKEFSKRLLRERGLPVGDFLVFDRTGVVSYEEASKKLGKDLFIKPASLGSSVGINPVRNEKQYNSAIREAFNYDTKIIVEQRIRGREIECSVLGNEDPIASLPGEIVPRREFYSYDAKYLDKDGAELIIPAKLDSIVIERIKNLAVEAFRTLGCSGLARVDFFLVEEGEESKIFINEVNTIPGFTPISMYPKLWEESGISQPELVDRLVELAVEKFRAKSRLKRFYE